MSDYEHAAQMRYTVPVTQEVADIESGTARPRARKRRGVLAVLIILLLLGMTVLAVALLNRPTEPGEDPYPLPDGFWLV